MTNPSRVRSNGRLALPGSSLRVDIARSRSKAPNDSGESGDSAPPASMTSASPRRMAWSALPIATAPEAQLIELVSFGPLKPNSIAMLQEEAPPKTEKPSVGDTLR
nr:hypothetical protein [Paenibacillus sp. P22]